MLAFAEPLGRIAGAVQAKTAGWIDGDTLKMGSATAELRVVDLIAQQNPQPDAELPRHGNPCLAEPLLL